MILTREMRSYLIRCGYAEKDFAQIEDATLPKYTVIKCQGKKISHAQARAFLGDKDYVSGIARSAFHYTAARVGSQGIVFFDSSKLFKE